MSQIRVSHHTIIHDVAHVQNMWLWHLNLVYHTEHATFNLQSEPLLVTPRAGGGWIRINPGTWIVPQGNTAEVPKVRRAARDV